ncbi:MAG: HAMP domain-containing histidine kinase [Hydrogenophaga sp.]|jgi:signal transduction histidine kinase|nr:HAMP domain-containing histidine kinase [Hydrogenophaga sp.]
MFRRRLSLVLVLLAAAVVLQAVAAVFAAREAERQVVRGRIASDIHQRFVELSATKQRLRSWVTQFQIGAGGDVAERDALEQRMRAILGELKDLTQQASAKGLEAGAGAEQAARQDALQVLGQSVETLSAAIREKPPLSPNVQARQAWDTLTAVFERSEGRDLRQIIAQSIEREQAAMDRERAAADASLARMRAWWMGTALLLALGALAATAYFGRALRRPLDALTAGAQALQQGQLDHRIDLTGRDEFAAVARSMNTMAEELEQHRQREAQQRQLLEATVRERTTDLHQANDSLRRTDVRRRQLLADISHELRTPTTAIRGEAEVTLRGQDKPVAEYRTALARIVDISRQLGRVIDDLLAMARTDLETFSLVRQPVALQQPLLDALGQAAALAGEHGVVLKPEGKPPEHCKVFGDAQRLTQLLMLLLDNAVRYSQPGGVVRWQVQEQDDTVELRVIDEGIGIPADELAQVFERHFRGSVARRHRASGSGLGLPIARALAVAHGGSLELLSPCNPGGQGGTCAVLRLPLWNDPDSVLGELPMALSEHPNP